MWKGRLPLSMMMLSTVERQRSKPKEPPIIAGRVPPHDLDAEAAVLSAVMLKRDALDQVAEILKPEHFYSEANGRVFEAAVAQSAHPVPAGPLALRLCGHFPGQRLGIIGDVPAPAMRQWLRWCRTPGYLLDAEQQLVQTRRALLSSHVSLYAALGGGSIDFASIPATDTPNVSSGERTP